MSTETNDRDLLELAAKAAGVKTMRTPLGNLVTERDDGQQWNPLADDGDALRLAVTLSLNVERCPDDVGRYVRAWRPGTEMIAAPVSVVEEFEAKGDPCAATRRAIVRAAAMLAEAR